MIALLYLLPTAVALVAVIAVCCSTADDDVEPVVWAGLADVDARRAETSRESAGESR